MKHEIWNFHCLNYEGIFSLFVFHFPVDLFGKWCALHTMLLKSSVFVIIDCKVNCTEKNCVKFWMMFMLILVIGIEYHPSGGDLTWFWSLYLFNNKKTKIVIDKKIFNSVFHQVVSVFAWLETKVWKRP